MKFHDRPKRHQVLEALITEKNVLSAVILRDMRTRFFNHGLGFAIVPLWSLTHMVVLIIINSLAGRAAAFGESMPLFLATGLVPTLTFMYVSRFMGYSVLMNAPMLAFPVVTSLDVMFGRGCLEIISSSITLTVIMVILWAIGQNPWPFDLEQAVSCYMAVILLAVGCGTLVGVVGMFLPMILTVWQIALVCLYISSGTMFVASNLPDQIAVALSYNPVLQCVEWMRTAYYESYSDKLVDPMYVWGFGLVTLALGLTVERVFRRQMLEG
ncbi:capsular biosynthesis protein [Rhizobium sp. OK494]|uniref:ABC transporter permease n=1 Tax=Rhizobium sp. 11_C7_N12_5 TaxID=3240770 RepID=UPI000562E340